MFFLAVELKIFEVATSAWATDGNKLLSYVRLRNSAEILVLGPRLCTRVWVSAMIGVIDWFANQVEGKVETHCFR